MNITRAFTWLGLIFVLLAVLAVMKGMFWLSIGLLVGVVVAGILLTMWNAWR
jgi:hypothetical protein